MKIIYTQPNGSTAVVAMASQADVAVFAPEVADMNPQQYAQWIEERALPLDATNVQVVEDDMVPVDHAGMIAAAHARINAAYEAAIAELNGIYPASEIDSWPTQDAEARALLLDKTADTPWLKGASKGRDVAIENLALRVKKKSDKYLPAYGELTGKRQKLRDAIEALGANATQAQLDAIQWGK